MVNLLWAKGLVNAAVDLEELWNDVQREVNCSLMCAYPMRSFAEHNDAAPFLRVCAQHSHIFPTQQKRALDPVSPLA